MHTVCRFGAATAIVAALATFTPPLAIAQSVAAKDAPQCAQHGDRAARQARKYDSFRWDKRAENAQQRRQKGKFTPRYPVDVDTVVRIRGETRRTSGVWTDAVLMCGFNNGRLVATDLMVREDEIRPGGVLASR